MKKKRRSISDQIKEIPASCGVYIFKTDKGKVIYIGKAFSLKKRISSHFSSSSIKRDIFLKLVDKIEFIVTDTEEQALILEASLIKEKKPKYNVSLRDDKSYPYVEITDEQFPRVGISRPKSKSLKKSKGKGTFFGPYTETKVLKSALKLIRQVFPYRTCRRMPKKPCLYFHLKLCPAPCIENISATQYAATIKNVSKVLKGQRKELMRILERKMSTSSRRMNFEEAAKLRDQIMAVYNLYWGRRGTNELVSLKQILNLSHMPLTIEAMDISSLGAKLATGSVVVFKNGIADKNSYRRFKIKSVRKIDDYAMIAEVVKRRYQRLLDENKKLPDLIIIDGGKGHVQTAKDELDKLSISTPVIGIAKKNEEIWFPDKNKPLVIAKDQPCLHLVQRIRDEAHRFAKKYHKLLRSKKMTEKNSDE